MVKMKDKVNASSTPISSLNTSKSFSKRFSLVRPRRNLCDRPTPLDFDAFIPWVCLEWQMPVNVVVTRVIQEEYVNQDDKKSTPSRSAKKVPIKLNQDDVESSDQKKYLSHETVLFEESISMLGPFVPIQAVYDKKQHLVEIVITDCSLYISRIVIQAFSICIPFHSLLTKLTIRKGGLTNALLYDISKMIAHSNLTDVCLDDCKVPLENYDVLLDHDSKLKRLSLNRCNIDDTVCEKLSVKIEFSSPGSSLLVLELGYNLISDRGAIAIALSLRRNRCLLHLNLAGNKISDDGANALLTHLMEFALTWDEIFIARQRKLKYSENKLKVYASTYVGILNQQRADMTYSGMTIDKPFKVNRKKWKKSDKTEEKPAVNIADAMTREVVGKFTDPYDATNIVKKNGRSHSKGNMVLCSLNLAYNNLSFISVQKVYEVLKYQEGLDKTDGATGLMRVVFEGNEIPIYCAEYTRIEKMLKNVIIYNTPVQTTHTKKKNAARSVHRNN